MDLVTLHIIILRRNIAGIICVVIAPLLLHAQSDTIDFPKWSIGIHAAKHYSYYPYQDDAAKVDTFDYFKAELDSNLSVGYKYGLTLHYRINKHFSLTTGLLKSKNAASITKGRMEYIQTYSFGHLVSAGNVLFLDKFRIAYYYYHIPLGIRFSPVNSRLTVNVTLGLDNVILDKRLATKVSNRSYLSESFLQLEPEDFGVGNLDFLTSSLFLSSSIGFRFNNHNRIMLNGYYTSVLKAHKHHYGHSYGLGINYEINANRLLKPKKKDYNNLVYVQLLGEGFLYSFNYERVLFSKGVSDIYFRTGIGVVGPNFPIFSDNITTVYLPLGFNYRYGKRVKLKAGATVTTAHPYDFLLFIPSLGCQFMDRSQFFIGVSATPFIFWDYDYSGNEHTFEVVPWVGLSIGQAF